jgi:hypothetical protein
MKVWKRLILTDFYPETLLQTPNIKLEYVKLDFDELNDSHPPSFELHYYHYPKIEHKVNKNHVETKKIQQKRNP